MKEFSSREKILEKIRKASLIPSSELYPGIDLDSAIYQETDEPPEILFGQRFTEVGGKFIFSESLDEFCEELNGVLRAHPEYNLFCREKKLKAILASGNIPFADDEAKLTDATAGISFCEFLIARTGSILVSSAQESGRKLWVHPLTHIVVAFSDQIVMNSKDAMAGIRKKYSVHFPSLVTVITGPSRSADIEKTLILGAHGPKEIYLFLIDIKSE